MIRSILAVVAGLVVAQIIFLGFETLDWLFYIRPLGLDMSNEEAMNAAIRDVPVTALLVVVLGYFVGTFCGIALTIRIARRAPVIHAAILCAIVLIGNYFNLQSMPHPQWFWIASFATFPLAATVSVLVVSSRQ